MCVLSRHIRLMAMYASHGQRYTLIDALLTPSVCTCGRMCVCITYPQKRSHAHNTTKIARYLCGLLCAIATHKLSTIMKLYSVHTYSVCHITLLVCLPVTYCWQSKSTQIVLRYVRNQWPIQR